MTNWKKLIKKFKPVVILHEDEDYFPASIDFILQNSELFVNNKCLVSKGHLNRNNLSLFSKKYGSGTFVDINSKVWDGEEFNMDNVPFYVSYYETAKYYVLQYIFIYAYNGPFNVLKWKIGAHQFDCEHVSFFIDKKTETIDKAYFAAHRSRDGKWVKNDNIEYIGSQPVVYSAKHSHASYWKSGTFDRICFMANDTTNDGFYWNPSNCEIIDNKTKWNQFTGTFGKNGIGTPKTHDWWLNEKETNSNWFLRMFCPCW